jgi:hypothetical protein
MIDEVKLVKWTCDDCDLISGIVEQGKTPKGWKQFKQIPTYVAQCCPMCSRRREGPIKQRELWKQKTGKFSRRLRRVEKL